MAIEVDHEDDSTDGTDDCNPRYIGHELDPQISRTLRLVCLTVILLMAGLELDPVALMKLSAMVLRATFIPERIVISIKMCEIIATLFATYRHRTPLKPLRTPFQPH